MASCRRLGRKRRFQDNHIAFALDQIRDQLWCPSVIAAGGSPLYHHIASLNVACVEQSAPELLDLLLLR